jgi:succinate dehydrogenase / fumarate reductase membrane anchor subunit
MSQGAERGSRHWLWQRATSLALIPLSLWFVPAVVALSSAPHARAAAWLASPANAFFAWLFVATACLHAALGLRVVLDDYVSHSPTRDGAARAVNILMIVLAVLAAAAIASA